MATVNMRAEFAYDIKKVWEIVTSLNNYSWRRDLSEIIVLSENSFIEHTKDGYKTTFTVTCREEYKRWEFDMENDNMSGHWKGVFSYTDGITSVDFTETVKAKKLLLKPFMGIYLRKQQAAYVKDLEKELNNKTEG